MNQQTPVNNRKDLLLLVLAAMDGQPVVGVTRLQKYVFLLQERLGWKERLASPYEFRAYDYGPFDDQIYADLDFLENIGFLARKSAGPETGAETGEEKAVSDLWATRDPEFVPESENDHIWSYQLTDKGAQFVRDKLPLGPVDTASIENLKSEWNAVPLAKFLRWLYAEYPDSAVNSKLTHLRAK